MNEAAVQSILREAAILVGKAEAAGVTLRIEAHHLQPLAMGNTAHKIEARVARHGPVPAASLSRFGAHHATPIMKRTQSG